MSTYTADPSSKLDYVIDWGPFLVEGETLTASTWVVPTGITQTTPPPSHTGAGLATIWLTGGTSGTRYWLTNHVTTSAGRQHDQSISVYVQDL